MKKKNLKVLTLKKKVVSDLQEIIRGGLDASGALSCKPAEPEPVTILGQGGCRDTRVNWCDSRFGGCQSYYC